MKVGKSSTSLKIISSDTGGDIVAAAEGNAEAVAGFPSVLGCIGKLIRERVVIVSVLEAGKKIKRGREERDAKLLLRGQIERAN